MELNRLNFRIQRRNNLNNVFYNIERQKQSNGIHDYVITRNDGEGDMVAKISFQNGARNEPGSITGVLDSDLIEIVKHRLEQFQAGKFACRENALAVNALTEALFWIAKRANDRDERGVLGTYIK